MLREKRDKGLGDRGLGMKRKAGNVAKICRFGEKKLSTSFTNAPLAAVQGQQSYLVQFERSFQRRTCESKQ